MSDYDKFMVKVDELMPTFDECYKFCNSPDCGAVSSFIGTTRNSFQGKRVTMLSYEGYVPMAEKELLKLCIAASSQWDITKIAIVHKLGDCPVGNASVIIVASSPHRRASLEAVSFLIDELKATVPIWKREIYEGDEGSVWKENIEWHEAINIIMPSHHYMQSLIERIVAEICFNRHVFPPAVFYHKESDDNRLRGELASFKESLDCKKKYKNEIVLLKRWVVGCMDQIGNLEKETQSRFEFSIMNNENKQVRESYIFTLNMGNFRAMNKHEMAREMKALSTNTIQFLRSQPNKSNLVGRVLVFGHKIICDSLFRSSSINKFATLGDGFSIGIRGEDTDLKNTYSNEIFNQNETEGIFNKYLDINPMASTIHYPNNERAIAIPLHHSCYFACAILGFKHDKKGAFVKVRFTSKQVKKRQRKQWVRRCCVLSLVDAFEQISQLTKQNYSCDSIAEKLKMDTKLVKLALQTIEQDEQYNRSLSMTTGTNEESASKLPQHSNHSIISYESSKSSMYEPSEIANERVDSHSSHENESKSNKLSSYQHITSSHRNGSEIVNSQQEGIYEELSSNSCDGGESDDSTSKQSSPNSPSSLISSLSMPNASQFINLKKRSRIIDDTSSDDEANSVDTKSLPPPQNQLRYKARRYSHVMIPIILKGN